MFSDLQKPLCLHQEDNGDFILASIDNEDEIGDELLMIRFSGHLKEVLKGAQDVIANNMIQAALASMDQLIKQESRKRSKYGKVTPSRIH